MSVLYQIPTKKFTYLRMVGKTTLNYLCKNVICLLSFESKSESTIFVLKNNMFSFVSKNSNHIVDRVFSPQNELLWCCQIFEDFVFFTVLAFAAYTISIVVVATCLFSRRKSCEAD